MSAHDRYESLAGAVMLGEATSQERATFDAHAATCARCSDDAADGVFVGARIAQANRSETWRPSQPIVERLHARRSLRARFTLGALGWAVGLSLVLNIAFVSGVGARVGAAFLSVAEPASDVASTRITLEAPRRALPPAAHVSSRRPKAPVAMRGPIAHHRARTPVVAHAAPIVTPRDPTIDDIPDVLAGVDLYGEGNGRRAVAHVAVPRCAVPAADAAEDETSVRACRDAAGRIEHEPTP